MKKRNIILLVIAIVLFVLVGSSMAYFGWSSTSENKDQLVDVTISGGTGSCDKASDNQKLLYPTSSRENGRIITVKAKQQMAQNAFISWNLKVNSINEDSLTTDGLKHQSFKYELVNTTTGVSYGSGNFENISEEDTITISTTEETLDYNKEYTFTLYLWIDGTIGNNPLDMSGQPYDFDLTCSITGADTKVGKTTLAEYITNLYTDATKSEVTNNSIIYNYATSVSLMNDRLGGTTSDYDGGNIRYYGASPNNYIYFNCSDYSNQTSDTCELWRIIGVFNGKVKIIRNEIIGDYAWDNKTSGVGTSTSAYGSNDWSDSRLMIMLNPTDYSSSFSTNIYAYDKGSYWYGLSSTCYAGSSSGTKACDFTSIGLKNDTTRNLISTETYYINGYNSSSVYSDEMYNYERTTGSVYSGHSTSWTGKIALAYPSDYGYAADFNYCTQTLFDYNNSTCTSNNWMKNILGTSSYGWLLTPYSDYSYYAWYVHSLDYVNRNYTYLAYGVAPVLSLNSVLSVETGTGESGSPYQLAIE